MKTLDTTIWPHWTNDLNGTCYADKHDRAHPVNVDFETYRKRLQDYQLAAEYWKAAYAAATFKARRRTRQLETMERFATLPHAAESDYQ